MTRPETLIRGIRDMAQALLDAHPMFEAVEAYKAAPTLRASGGGNGRSSDVPDPVHAIVASMQPYDEFAAAVLEAHGHLRAIQRQVYASLEEHPRIAQAADVERRRWRCIGTHDPTCTRWADRLTGKYAGLCLTCTRAIQREEQLRREQAS